MCLLTMVAKGGRLFNCSKMFEMPLPRSLLSINWDSRYATFPAAIMYLCNCIKTVIMSYRVTRMRVTSTVIDSIKNKNS